MNTRTPSTPPEVKSKLSMKRDQFERVVNEAIAELPEEFRRKLENVIVIVDDRPSSELLDKMEVPTW